MRSILEDVADTAGVMRSMAEEAHHAAVEVRDRQCSVPFGLLVVGLGNMAFTGVGFATEQMTRSDVAASFEGTALRIGLLSLALSAVTAAGKYIKNLKRQSQ